MENLSSVIRAIFVKMDGDEVLKELGFWNIEEKDTSIPSHLDSDIMESNIVNRLLEVNSKSTIDQLSMLGQIVQHKWMEKDKACISLQFQQDSSVFNILLHFASKCLIIKDREPLCQYHYLLRWHMLTTMVGEDLFTTSFLASRDIKLKYERQSFDWSAFIGHNCKELNNLFEKPISELHMHLNGSSYNFDLSWQCLMNNICRMQKHFENEHPYNKYKESAKDMYEKMKRAAFIRYYLAGAVGCIPQKITTKQLYDALFPDKEFIEKCKQDIKTTKDNERITFIKDLLKNKKDIQECIDQNRNSNQKKSIDEFYSLKQKQNFDNDLQTDDVLDYIYVSHYSREPIENKVLASERKFMYMVFKAIYKDDKKEHSEIATLFYAYLLYKSYFRHEILQLNERVGFANFASYEEKKTDYILDEYKHLLYKAAIEGFLEKGRDNNRFLEARIAPKESEDEIVKYLNKICNEINPKYKGNYDFIFHFIKQRDERLEKSYRHFNLRERIKRQSYAIYNFRNNKSNWESGDFLVGKVVGLDAANSEIFCRPEVYAQAFRFLRGHELSISEDVDSYPDDLNVTYHIGEDFMDIADGLRAVEEALIFLNLRNGDRLGHALVLGTDVRRYYEKRCYTICATKQVILDNLAWLHHKCIRLSGYTQMCGWLEIMFLKYFTEIYGSEQHKDGNIIESLFAENKNEEKEKLSDNIQDYYLSWLLRGHSPIIGLELDPKQLNEESCEIDKQWAFAGINQHEWAIIALKNERAKELFDAYHSHKYASIGDQGDTLTIPYIYLDEWYRLLENIQEQLLEKIERKHIAIECNPSSNYKIGEFETYEEHPILKFFNYGLSTPYANHDIAVSINTDDQGIFATSLEREYSLMSLAIERSQTEDFKNSPRAIVEWLNRVREMSMEQRFKH